VIFCYLRAGLSSAFTSPVLFIKLDKMSKASVSWETMLRAREEWERAEKLKKMAKRLEEKRIEDAISAKKDQDLMRVG
jgi:hypothetical protein